MHKPLGLCIVRIITLPDGFDFLRQSVDPIGIKERLTQKAAALSLGTKTQPMCCYHPPLYCPFMVPCAFLERVHT